MAQTQELRHGLFCCHVIIPGFFAKEFIVGAVQAHDGREYTELQPAHAQLVIPIAEHMTADVVAPPGVTCVAGVGGEIGLEVQRFPGGVGIAGEADGIAVGTDARVTGEGQRLLAIAAAVQEMQVV